VSIRHRAFSLQTEPEQSFTTKHRDVRVKMAGCFSLEIADLHVHPDIAAVTVRCLGHRGTGGFAHDEARPNPRKLGVGWRSLLGFMVAPAEK
jgi:hypothetical protein